MLKIKTTPTTEIAIHKNKAQIEIMKANNVMLETVSRAKSQFARDMIDKAVELGYYLDADEVYEDVFSTVGYMSYDDVEGAIDEAEKRYNEALAIRDRAADYLPVGDKMLEILNEQVNIAEEALGLIKEAIDYIFYVGDAELELIYIKALFADDVETLKKHADEVRSSVVESVKSRILL